MNGFLNILFSVGVYAVILVVIIGLFYLAIQAFKPDDKMKTAWAELANLTGLLLTYPRIGFPKLDGSYENRAVKVRASPGSGGSDGGPSRTHYYAEHKRATMAKLRLEPKGDLSFQADIKLGLEDFDNKYKLTCRNPEIARAFFDESVIAELLNLDRPTLVIDTKNVLISEVGLQKDVATMRDRLVLVSALAERIELV